MGEAEGEFGWANGRPRIAIVGAGAVGGYYGARLAQRGHDVHFLLRGDYDAVRAGGWNVRSIDGDFSLPPDAVHVYDDARRMPPADLVVVTLKATVNDALPSLVTPLLKDDTTLLTIQNGLGNEERLAALVEPERVLGGMAFVCINRLGPGRIHHSAHGLIRIGQFRGGLSRRATAVAEAFCAGGLRCEVLGNLLRGRYEKLVWNVPFNGLGAVLDRTTDRLIGTAEGRALLATLMREVMATAAADGAALEMGPEEMIALQLQRTAGMGAYASSMQEDRRHGRAMEIEAILGEPLRRAQAFGVPTPYLRALHDLARLVNDGAETPGDGWSKA